MKKNEKERKNEKNDSKQQIPNTPKTPTHRRGSIQSKLPTKLKLEN